MIPILFPADAATYTTQGLGALSDAISCKVREERNGEYELEMQYPQAGLHFSEISDRCIILAIPSPWRAAQPFRIYRITKPLNGVCTIYARHITYDLSGIPVNAFSAQSAAGALSGLKTNSATVNPFEFWTDKQTAAAFAVSVPASIRSLLGGRTGSVLDVYGGEYEWDGWTVRLHEHRGTDRGVTIRYGKNLTDIEQDRNIANVRTGLYPYWADSDGNLVVCDPPIVNAPGSYDFINIQTVDFSQEWQEAPTPAQLKARAEQYIQANEIGVPTVSISVSFVDLSRTDQYKDLALLEQCDLCDTVTVQFEALGIDATAEVVRIETDVLLERYDKIEVGSLRTNIADTIVDNQQRTDEQIKQTTSYLEDRIQQSTDLITNGGGYIYRKFDAAKNWVEIGSTDNLDLSKAIHVWRWNNGGFGHSGNGYNGPYRTAITQDGHIVADFVDVGTLTANLIRAGILQDVEGKAFYLDLPNGVLRMNATELSISGAPAASQSYAQQQAQAAQQAAIAAATKDLENYADTVTETVGNLQSQIDGQITTWFEDYDPTTSNAPANEWDTESLKQQHAGDLFYNNTDGGCFRWSQVGGTWQWVEIVDTDIAAALATANEAKDVADSKRRVFMVQPTPPYDEGDLWVLQNNGPLMVCINARQTGSYSAADWGDAANYADQFVGAGKNLLANSAFSFRNGNNTYSWITENSYIYDAPRAGLIYNPYLYVADNEDIQQFRNQDVTFSVEILASEGVQSDGSHDESASFYGARFEISYTDGSKQYIPPSLLAKYPKEQELPDWTKFVSTGKVADKEISSVRVVCLNQYVFGKICYRFPKLELGTAATSWTPNPSDGDIYATYIVPNARNLMTNTQFLGITPNGQLGTIKDGVITVECDGTSTHLFDTGSILDLTDEGMELCNNLPEGYSIRLSVDVKVDEAFVFDSSVSGAGCTVNFAATSEAGTYGYYLPTATSGEDYSKVLGLNVTDGWLRLTRDLPVSSALKGLKFRVRVYGCTAGKLSVRNPCVTLGQKIYTPPYSQAPEDMELAAKGELMTQEQVFNKLTNNGQIQGLFMQNGNLYVNGSYIRSGTIDANLVNVTNLNADNIKSGTITGRAIIGGTITGTSISGGGIDGALYTSRTDNGEFIQINKGSFWIFGTSNTSRLQISPDGDNSGIIQFWTTDGFWCGRIRGYRDGDLGRIEVTMGNNGFFTANRIQAEEVTASGSGMYGSTYYISTSNGNKRVIANGSGASGGAFYVDTITTKNGVGYSVTWTYDSNLGKYVLTNG